MTPVAEFISVAGHKIAVCFDDSQAPSNAPVVVWLGGFKSDMRGTKAERLALLAQKHGFAFLRFDYSGHGESGGAFIDGTISSWLNDAEAVIQTFAKDRLVLLVGSSMGAWISLRMVQNHVAKGGQSRIVGLVLLAPAPDFTCELIEPHLSANQQHDLVTKGFFKEPSAYGHEPYIYTKALMDDGLKNRVLTGIIQTHCPVVVLQGMADTDVPYQHALRLMSHLPNDNAILTMIKDGDHRLSREQDLILLEKAVVDLLASKLNAQK